MITLTSKSLILLITELGYYDCAFDTDLGMFFEKHNIVFDLTGGQFKLRFPTEYQEFLFRVTYSTLIQA